MPHPLTRLHGRIARAAAALLGIVLLAAPAAGDAFTDLVVFGDSLSDVGNLSNISGGIYPGPYYSSGRVSNGAVWAEHFSTGLGLGPLSYSRAGGDDFAFAGARTTGTPFPDNLFIRDLDDQITSFLNGRTANATTLYVVWVGANDLLNQLDGGSGNETQYVNTIISQMGRLRGAGARQFMVPNLPDLGLTPRFNASPDAAAATAASLAFNSALASALDAMESSDPSLTLFRLDIASAFNEIASDPWAFGLVNATSPAAPGLSVGDSSYDTSQIVPNPHEYLFWDELHPTAAGHSILGQYVMSSIPEPAGLSLVCLALVVVCRRRACEDARPPTPCEHGFQDDRSRSAPGSSLT